MTIFFAIYSFIQLKIIKAQFDAHEMITQREVVGQRISLALAQRAANFGILLDDISIVSPFSFTWTYSLNLTDRSVANPYELGNVYFWDGNR